MKAVILAAGFGKRMGAEKPKPLLNLFGMPIIEHSIRKLKGHDIIVVYHDKEIEEFIKKKFPEIKLVYNDEPERENGWSLYLSRSYINDDFLLLMADHYYGNKFFKIDEFDETTVFVSSFSINASEATKVKVENEKVVDIGKGLQKYDYFDTGFFYCKYEIFDYIEKMKSKEKISLSDVISKLSMEKKVGYKILQEKWIDIDTKKELKEANKIVENSLSKTWDGIISKNINRKISKKITKAVTRYNFFTPNVMTMVSFLLGIFSSILFFMNILIPAGIMAQICSIIDGCDGEIARIKNMKTRFGGVFDALTDRLADFLIILGMLFSYGLTEISVISFFLAFQATILPSYIYHLTNIRVSFFGRDARLFSIMVGATLAYFNKDFLIYTMIFIGVLAYAGIVMVMHKFWNGIS